MKPDILIINCRLILSGNDAGQALTPSFIAIHKGLIALTGAMATLDPNLNGVKVIDASGDLVLPGLINSHNHCAMTLFRGLADDLPLNEWLHDNIFPAESRFVSPDMVYWCTRLAASEMILSGTTTVADGYFYENEAARALVDSGMRAVAAQGIIDFPAPGVQDPQDNIDAAAEFIEKWQDHDLITPAIFCHSPYTCSAQTIIKSKELARENGLKLFIHVAETEGEVLQSRARLSISPIRFLADLDVLDHNTICIHCVWLDDDDIRIMKESDAAIITCTESNLKLGAGFAPVAKFLKQGIRIGIGTDGSASNNDLDMFSEMDMTAKLHKGVGCDPTVLPAADVLSMATKNGASILGLNDAGELSVGMKADLIIIDTNKPHLTPLYDPKSLLVYSASGADVRTSIINGRIVMEDRVLQGVDIKEILDQVREIAARVKKDT